MSHRYILAAVCTGEGCRTCAGDLLAANHSGLGMHAIIAIRVTGLVTIACNAQLKSNTATKSWPPTTVGTAMDFKRLIAREWLAILKCLAIGAPVGVVAGMFTSSRANADVEIAVALFFAICLAGIAYIVRVLVLFTRWSIKTVEGTERSKSTR